VTHIVQFESVDGFGRIHRLHLQDKRVCWFGVLGLIFDINVGGDFRLLPKYTALQPSRFLPTAVRT
jgi:hypothetical protein